jgi:pentapeptide MXKDX repeat protein
MEAFSWTIIPTGGFMKKVLLAASCFLALTAGSAFAQPSQPQGGASQGTMSPPSDAGKENMKTKEGSSSGMPKDATHKGGMKNGSMAKDNKMKDDGMKKGGMSK